jgi:hypothetical protein
MNRAIVLLVCLASAAVIVACTHCSRGDAGEPADTVPAHPTEVAPDRQMMKHRFATVDALLDQDEASPLEWGILYRRA